MIEYSRHAGINFIFFLKHVITPELTITYLAHAVLLLVLTLLCK